MSTCTVLGSCGNGVFLCRALKVLVWLSLAEEESYGWSRLLAGRQKSWNWLDYPCWLTSESHRLSLCLPLKELQVLVVLRESRWEVSSYQLRKEAGVPQLNRHPPHDEVLSWNPEGTFWFVTDLMWPRRWRKHLFTSQWRPIWAPEGHLPRPWPFPQQGQKRAIWTTDAT